MDRRHARLTPLALLGVLASCGAAPADDPSARRAPAAAGIPDAAPPWTVVASAEIGRGATRGAKPIVFDADGTGRVVLGDPTTSPTARFRIPEGRSPQLTVTATEPGTTPSSVQGQLAATVSATNRSGATVTAWTEYEVTDDGRDRTRLRAAFGDANGPVGEPVTLRESSSDLSYLDNVAVDLDEAGRAAIVVGSTTASGRPSILAWTGTRTADLGRPPLAKAGVFAGNLGVALTTSGTMVVAWEPPQGGEDEHPPTPISAMALPPGRTSFSPVQVVDPGRKVGYPRGFGLEPAADGTALLTWTGTPARGGGKPLLVARTDASGRVAAGRQTLVTGETLGGLATRADGAAIITSAADDTATRAGRGSSFVLAPGAGSFGAREMLPLPRAVLSSAGAPPPAFDPRTGPPVVAYVVPGTKTSRARLVVAVRDAPG